MWIEARRTPVLLAAGSPAASGRRKSRLLIRSCQRCGRRCRGAAPPVGHVDGNNQRTPPGADSLEPMPGVPALGHKRYYPPVTPPPPPATDLRLVVGYDGSPPATRALDGAVNLLQ